MSKRETVDARQIIFRAFPEKMPGITGGDIKAFIVPLRPQPPEGAEFAGASPLNGRVFFTYGQGAYFFPKTLYQNGETIYIREEWGINPEAEPPAYIYKAGSPAGPAQWKTATSMPVEAARIFLQVTDTDVFRIQNISQADAKATGAGGRGWRRELELQWNAGLKPGEKKDLAYQENPWVQIVRFRTIDRPAEWPSGINQRILEHGTNYNRYTIRLAATGEIIASGTAAECAEAMGYKDHKRIYSLLNHVASGNNQKYIIEVSKSKKVHQPRSWLRGE